MSSLASRLRAAALAGPDPEGAPVRVERWLQACEPLGGAEACTPSGAEELLALLTSQSAYLSAPLIRDPPALARLAGDPFLDREKDAATLAAELEQFLDGQPLQPALRRFRNREYLRLGARELGHGSFE